MLYILSYLVYSDPKVDVIFYMCK